MQPARIGDELVVDVDHLTGADGEHAVRGAVLVPTRDHDRAQIGDGVRVAAAALHAPSRRRGALGAAMLARLGVSAEAVSPMVTLVNGGTPGALPARLLDAIRGRVAGAAHSVLPEPIATLLSAIAFGVRGPLPRTTSVALQRSGLIHLVAVSGLKVAIVAGLAARAAGIWALPRRSRPLLIAAVVGGYVAVAGAGPAATRSAVMAITALTLREVGRRPAVIPLMAVTAALMVAVDPSVATETGFQLSFLGTLGIVLGAESLARRLPGPRLLVEPFAVTVAAQVATIPVTASAFGSLSLVGPLANAVTLPLLPVLLITAWSGAVLAAVAGPLAWLPLQAAGLLTGWAAAVANLSASLPGAAFDVGGWPRSWSWAAFAGAVVGSAAWVAALRSPPRASRPARPQPLPLPRWPLSGSRRRGVALTAAATAACLAGAAVVVAAGRPDGRLHVAVLDVGGGTAVLVDTSAGGRALVDAGSDPDRLQQALGPHFAPLSGGVDLVVLTGGERTVVAGLDGLSGRYLPQRLMLPDVPLGSGARAAVDRLRARGTDVVPVPVASPWTWGGAEWRCLAPAPPDVDGPAQPVCALQVVDAGTPVLIAGDLAPLAQEELAALHSTALRSRLLVAPAGGALAPALLDAVRPRMVAVPGRLPRGPAAGSGPPMSSTDKAGTLTYAGAAGELAAQ